MSGGFRYDRQAPVPITSWNQPLNGCQTADYEVHILNVAAAQSAPEPDTLLLMGAGPAALAALVRRSLMN